ncbi:MAG: YdcF family protein, partial [Synechococcales cyanobacterium]
MVASLEWQNIPLEKIPQAEAIVVLGGATKPAAWPRSTVDLNASGERVIYAVQLYGHQGAQLSILSGERI